MWFYLFVRIPLRYTLYRVKFKCYRPLVTHSPLLEGPFIQDKIIQNKFLLFCISFVTHFFNILIKAAFSLGRIYVKCLWQDEFKIHISRCPRDTSRWSWIQNGFCLTAMHWSERISPVMAETYPWPVIVALHFCRPCSQGLFSSRQLTRRGEILGTRVHFFVVLGACNL